jgi:hypothetical protein
MIRSFATMKTILALTAAAAALMAASTANAQECVNGYRTFGNDIVQPCHPPMAPHPMVGMILAPVTPAPPPPEEEIIITGSIAPGNVAPPPPQPIAPMDDGCMNGYRTLGNDVIVLCGPRR